MHWPGDCGCRAFWARLRASASGQVGGHEVLTVCVSFLYLADRVVTLYQTHINHGRTRIFSTIFTARFKTSAFR